MQSTVPMLSALALAAALLLPSPAAQAALLKDATLQSLMDSDRLDELERQAGARLKANPDDVPAAVALAMASLSAPEPKRLEAAARSMQACIDRVPSEASCHHALGAVMGVQAMTGGALKAMGLLGKIKAAFSKALELDPASYETRSALLQFYLAVPGIAGGSVSKARDLEAEIRTRQPEHAKMLRALIAAQAEKWADVERELLSIRAGQDTALLADVRVGYGQLARQLMKDKQFDRARSLIEQLMREQPSKATGPYVMGRICLEQGLPDEALKHFERARTLEGAEALPLDHRIGNAWQAKGDKAQARAAYERYITSRRADPRNADDARKKLAELG